MWFFTPLAQTTSIIYHRINKVKRFPKWLLITASVINLIGVFMSDSNGAILLLVGYILGFAIYKLLGGVPQLTIKKLFLKVIALMLVAVVSLALLLSVRSVVNKSASYIINSSNNISQQAEDKPIDKKPPNMVTFAHENDNLDSGRLKLLEKAIVVFYNNPIIGVGKENIVLFGKRLLETGFKYSDLHNGYLTILVSNGLVGFVLFIGFAVSIGKTSVKSLFLEKRSFKNNPYPCLFAFIFAYCIYAVIEKAMLWEHSFMVAIFWYMLGYLSCYVKKYDHEDDTFDIKMLFATKSKADDACENSDKPELEEINIIDVPTDE